MRSRKVTFGALAVGVLAVFSIPVFLGGGAQGRPQGANDAPPKVLRTRELPRTEKDFVVLYVWRNGKFHYIRQPTKTVIEETAIGNGESQITLHDHAAWDTLPPADRAFDFVNPTPEELAEAQRKATEMTAQLRGTPDPFAALPPHPGDNPNAVPPPADAAEQDAARARGRLPGH